MPRILGLSPILLVFALLSVCKQTEVALHPGEWQTQTVSGSFDVPLLVYYPKLDRVPEGGYPVLIALHGWNLHASEWKESGISRLADRYGLVVVCPQMGKANYEKEYFPETVMKWNPKPSGRWILEDLWPYLESQIPLSKDRKRHGVIGVSTGGHGALLLAGYDPERFGFAGMISGDFDVSETPEDGLARGSFGPYETFRDRWKASSAVAYMDSYANTRLYVGHGTADSVAPVSQARLLNHTFLSARKAHPGQYPFLYHEAEGAGHGWEYWKKELAPALEFFVQGF